MFIQETMSTQHNLTVRKAEKLGYRVTESSCGSTTMARKKAGITEFLHICHETGNFLGEHSI